MILSSIDTCTSKAARGIGSEYAFLRGTDLNPVFKTSFNGNTNTSSKLYTKLKTW